MHFLFIVSAKIVNALAKTAPIALLHVKSEVLVSTKFTNSKKYSKKSKREPSLNRY
jgi:hypothetical protein